MNDRLLGFDIRIADPGTVARWWLGEAPRTYLVRPDVARPVSVDRHVCPSVFAVKQDSVPGVEPDVELVEGRIVVEPTDMHHDFLGLWASWERMLEAFRPWRERPPGPAVMATAVSLIGQAPPVMDAGWQMVLEEPVEPAVLGGDWRSIGFDVADNWWISGLSNCGYEPGERESFGIDAWASRVNDHGLIRCREDALVFKELTDHRVPEHAPFAVFEIHRWTGDPRQGSRTPRHP